MNRSLQSIADLAAIGRHEQAIAAATDILADTNHSSDERMALLELRFDSHYLRMDLAQAEADVQALKALARRPVDAARQARALTCEALLQWRRGDAQASLETAKVALKAARRSGRTELEARSQVSLGRAQGVAGTDLPAALANLQQAAAHFAVLGDVRQQGRAICNRLAFSAPAPALMRPTRPRARHLYWLGNAATCLGRARP